MAFDNDNDNSYNHSKPESERSYHGTKTLVWSALLSHALEDTQIPLEEFEGIQNSRRVEEGVTKTRIYDYRNVLLPGVTKESLLITNN